VAGIVGGYGYTLHPGVISKTKLTKSNNNKYLYFLNIIKTLLGNGDAYIFISFEK
jgi:hypothetical protein